MGRGGRSSFSSFEQARIKAIVAAEQEHDRLGTDLGQRIDIFGIIEKAGVWLMFQPLRGLFGLYYREGEAAGIVVNARHPLSLQRFTAAHEYGHHVLRHGSTIDDEEHIYLGRGSLALKEVTAQAFAANFLMPLQLVNATFRRMGVSPHGPKLTPRQVYHFALELGVSYTAVVNHLAGLKVIPQGIADELRSQEPKRIKTEIGRGVRPQDVWADYWPLEEHDAGRRLYPRVNDELLVSLGELPSSGYVWTVAGPGVVDRSANENVGGPGEDEHLTLVSDEFEPAPTPGQEVRFGEMGTRRLTFRVNHPGRYTLRLVNRRPWQEGSTSAEVFEVDLEVQPKRTGDSDQGLSERQKPFLAVAA